MARQKGLIKLEGTIGDMTFYKGNGVGGKKEYLVKTPGGVSAERIASDPAFARTRENNSEFGRAARYGKLIRKGLAPVFSAVGNSSAAARFTQLMRKEISKDTANPRGERVVENVALSTLNGIELNDSSILSQVLGQNITVTRAVDDLLLKVGNSPIVPLQPADVMYPQGATHVHFSVHFMAIDLATEQVKAVNSFDMGRFPVNAPNAIGDPNFDFLSNADIAVGDAYLLVFLVQFEQVVNGIYYSLNNDLYKPARVVAAGVK